MSVKRRGDIWHYDFAIAGERFRGSTQQRSKAKALEVESRERARAKLGEASRPIPTLKEAADRWFAARMDDRKSAATTAIRIQIALRLVGASRLVSEIDTPDIEDAMQRRRLEETRPGKVPANATVNRDLIDSTLRPILRYCRRVLKLPVQEIDWSELRLSEPKGRSRTFTLAEMTAWRAGFPEHHRAVFDFIATYGARLTEAFFPLDSYDPSSGIIVVRERKNGLPHAIRLQADEARAMTARWGRAKEAKLETVWFRETRHGLEAITRRSFQSASRKALERACVADARAVHDLRHHAATAFLRLPGATMKHAQQLLGHESPASTARYAHVTTDDVFNVMRHAIATKAADEVNSSTDSTPRTGT